MGLHVIISLRNVGGNLKIPTWRVHRARALFFAILLKRVLKYD